MQMSNCRVVAAACVLISLGTAAQSDQVFADDVIIGTTTDANLCVGFNCSDGMAFGSETVKLFENSPRLEFDDPALSDWLLVANNSGFESFSIISLDSFATPFRIDLGAPSSSVIVASDGDVGFGTALPQSDLHVIDTLTTGLRMEVSGSGPFPPRIWEMGANSGAFYVQDGSALTTPLLVAAGAPTDALRITADGNVGMGATGSPEGKLHIKADGVLKAYFESGDGGPVQIRMRSDSENRRFLATSNDDTVRSQIIFKDNDIRFTGPTDSGANLWMIVGPSGLITRGPTCNPGPCDLVFDPEVFTPQSIDDHAAFMWENKHLEAIGPTGPGTQMNVTEKLGGVIHELEVAHIYIESLHDQLKTQRAALETERTRNDAQKVLNAALLARLDALEEAISGD